MSLEVLKGSWEFWWNLVMFWSRNLAKRLDSGVETTNFKSFEWKVKTYFSFSDQHRSDKFFSICEKSDDGSKLFKILEFFAQKLPFGGFFGPVFEIFAHFQLETIILLAKRVKLLEVDKLDAGFRSHKALFFHWETPINKIVSRLCRRRLQAPISNVEVGSSGRASFS